MDFTPYAIGIGIAVGALAVGVVGVLAWVGAQWTSLEEAWLPDEVGMDDV